MEGALLDIIGQEQRSFAEAIRTDVQYINAGFEDTIQVALQPLEEKLKALLGPRSKTKRKKSRRRKLFSPKPKNKLNFTDRMKSCLERYNAQRQQAPEHVQKLLPEIKARAQNKLAKALLVEALYQLVRCAIEYGAEVVNKSFSIAGYREVYLPSLKLLLQPQGKKVELTARHRDSTEDAVTCNVAISGNSSANNDFATRQNVATAFLDKAIFTCQPGGDRWYHRNWHDLPEDTPRWPSTSFGRHGTSKGPAIKLFGANIPHWGPGKEADAMHCRMVLTGNEMAEAGAPMTLKNNGDDGQIFMSLGLFDEDWFDSTNEQHAKQLMDAWKVDRIHYRHRLQDLTEFAEFVETQEMQAFDEGIRQGV
jgi:hypothetical protein